MKGIIFDFTIYTFFETLVILSILGVVFIISLHMLVKFLRNKNLSIKDWVKIEDKSERDDDKENIDRFQKRTNKKSGETEVAVLLNKRKAEEIFNTFKENIADEIKGLEKEKYRSILYFGYIVENLTSYIIQNYTDVFEAMLLSKTDKQTIELDNELLKDYHNFLRIAKIVNEETRVVVSANFASLFEACLENGTENCLKNSRDYAKKIILEIKKGFYTRLKSDQVSVKDFIQEASKLDKELYTHASKEVDKITQVIDTSILRVYKKLQRIENVSANLIKRLYN